LTVNHKTSVMKKNSILIAASLVLVSLLAYAFTANTEEVTAKVTPEEPLTKSFTTVAEEPMKVDFFYNFGSRFEPMRRSDILKAKSFDDFITPDLQDKIEKYYSVRVIEIIDDKEARGFHNGSGSMLNLMQLDFLRNAPLNTNLKINGQFHWYNEERGIREDIHASPHRTIVPQYQATYIDGKDGLIEWFRTKNKELTEDLDDKTLKAATLYFTIDTDGSIKEVYADRSCGYLDIDENIKQILMQTQGDWTPARDMNEKPVAQQLTISYGRGGC